jgi:transmembrane sensor
MASRETSRDVDAAAADWVAREDRAPLSDPQQDALNAWLQDDPRHAGALLRARAIALRSRSARALGTAYDPGDFAVGPAPAAPSRRRMLAWGGGLAASVATVAAIGVAVQAPNAHATDRGEVRLVPLPDGSTVMLNTATRVTVRYDGGYRRVRLVEGEADFSVVADDRRPFLVEAGNRRLIVPAVGGFRVRKLGDAPIDVLVHQGQVAVSRAGGGQPEVHLAANTHVALAEGRAVAPQSVAPGVVTRELAWRDGKIAFEGETLAQAAAAFARYSDVRIVIADPALAREPVTGLFAANDPVGFGRAVADLFETSMVERGGEVLIGRVA